MSYNPRLHHRRSIRLKGYDYSKAGLYFITICTHNRKCSFGEIVGAGFTSAPPNATCAPPNTTSAPPNTTSAPPNITGQPQGFAPTDTRMELNDFGIIAYEQWGKLPARFTNFELDVFQIMPNHMHGIILLNDNLSREVVEGMGVNGAGENPVGTVNSPTIGDIVGAYKSLVANECLEQFKLKHPNEMMGKLWQRNYHEHIIRDQKSYQRISEYIINNPLNWKEDKFYYE